MSRNLTIFLRQQSEFSLPNFPSETYSICVPKRYTKALDQIKAIRKEQTAESKVEKERLIAYKANRERAKKVIPCPE